MDMKELTRMAVIALIFFGIGAATAESTLNTFTLRADKVLTDYIGGNTTASEVNITGLVINAGQVTGYYNGSVTDVLLGDKANTSELTNHTGNTSNPHSVMLSQVGGAAAIHNHSGGDITSQVSDADTVDGYHAGNAASKIPVLNSDGKYVGIPLRNAAAAVQYLAVEADSSNAEVTGDSATWTDTGKSLTIDLTNIDYLTFHYEVHGTDTSQDDRIPMQLRYGGVTYGSSVMGGESTSYVWITATDVDVRGLTGNITFTIEIKKLYSNSGKGYNRGVNAHVNDFEGVDS